MYWYVLLVRVGEGLVFDGVFVGYQQWCIVGYGQVLWDEGVVIGKGMVDDGEFLCVQVLEKVFGVVDGCYCVYCLIVKVGQWMCGVVCQ